MPAVTHRRSPAQSRPGLAFALLAAALGGGCATLADPGSDGAGTPGAVATPAAAAAKPAAATSPVAPAVVPATATSPGSRPATATATATPAATPAPGQPRAFADVIKDATETPGFFRVWQKDDKVWLEIAPEQFDLPFRFQMNHARGIGEARVYGGMMGPSHIARLRKVGPNVQLIAANTQYTAKAGTPMAAAVREGFSESMLGSAAIASQPHPERKSVLVELNALLLTDLPAASYFAWGVHQRGYDFDARNSSIERVHAADDGVSALVLAHYSNPKATLPPSPAAGPAANPYPPFDTLPDRRSLFLGIHYSFTRLAEPMRSRAADPRIGHFVEEVWDYSDDRSRTARVNFVQRWRLEKKDPSAALSEPVAADRLLDRPQRARAVPWRRARRHPRVEQGVRADRLQGCDPGRDPARRRRLSTSDGRHPSVRWFAGVDVGFAIGPTATDGRTGEILDAAVAIPELWARGDRRLVREDLNTASAWPAFDATKRALGLDPRACTFATDALAEVEFGLDLLVARGEMAPDGPDAEAFVLASLKEVTMHEVGHTLGLRHNFRASTVYPLDRLADPEFTRANGLAGSVMDYQPVNLAPHGERQGEYHHVDAGAVRLLGDRVRVPRRSSRRPRRRTSPRIAARGATDPLLAFSSDEESARRDRPGGERRSTSATIRWPTSRCACSSRASCGRGLRGDGNSSRDSRTTSCAAASMRACARQRARHSSPTKYVGGVTYVRDFAGSGRDAADAGTAGQDSARRSRCCREAVFSADSFRFPPEFLQRMARRLTCRAHGAGVNPAFSLSARVLSLQAGGARPADERHGRRSDCSSPKPRSTPVGRRSGCPSSTRRCAARSGANSRPARTSRSSGATCSASTSTASPARCCGRRRRCRPTPARCCGSRRSRCAASSRRRSAGPAPRRRRRRTSRRHSPPSTRR